MAVIRNVIRGIIRPVIRDVIRDEAGGSVPEPGDPPVWIKFISNATEYQDQLPYTIDLASYVSYPAGEPVTSWSCTAPATMEAGTLANSLLTLNDAPGVYPITVTATNVNGSADSNTFTVEILAVSAPVLPEFGPIPDFYSVYGVAGGSAAPTAQTNTVKVFNVNDGIDMNDYITAGQPITHWSVTPTNVVTIDSSTGIITAKPGTVPSDYTFKVTATNADGSTQTPDIFWKVYSQDGYSFEFDKVSVGGTDLGGFDYTRVGSDVTVKDYLAADQTVNNTTATLVGHQWSGVEWQERNVGYGLQAFTGASATTVRSDIEGLPGVPAGFETELSGFVTIRLNEDLSNTSQTLFAFDSVAGAETSHLRVTAGSTAHTIRLSAQNTTTEGPVSVPSDALAARAGDVLDIRFKYNHDEGLKLWVDSVLTSDPSVCVASQALALTELGLSNLGTSGNDTACEIINVRIVPTGYLDDSVIEGWPVWEHPLPIIVQQPQSVQFSEQTSVPTGQPVIVGTLESGELVAANIDAIHDPIGIGGNHVYEWTADDVVVGGSGNSYMLTANEVGKMMKVAFSYTDTAGTPKGPLLSSGYGPVGEGVVVPPPTGDATKINSRSPYWAESYLLVDEGDTAVMWADARNVQSAELWYLPMNNPAQGSPPTTPEERDMERPFVPFTNQVPGVTFEKFLPIPAQDPDGKNLDQDGHRFKVTVANAQLGYDGWFHIVVYGGTKTQSTNHGRGRYHQIRPKHKWMAWQDVPNLYAWWTPEPHEPTRVNDPALPNQDRAVTDSDRAKHWSKWGLTILQYEYDMAAEVPFHVKSLEALEGSQQMMYPHGANPTSASSHLLYIREFQISNRKAFKIIGQVGLRHQYPTPYDAAGGITVAVADFHWYSNRVGTTFELTGPSGSYIKLGTSGNGKYQLSVNGGAAQETPFDVTPSEVIMVVLTATDSLVSLYVRAQFDRSPWPTAFTLPITSASVDTVSFLAEADDNATNASYGLFGSGTVIHQAFDAADTEELEKTMHKWIHYEGCYRAGYPESY